MGSPVLELENVEAGYAGVMVLDRVSLTVREGDFLGIIGPNGGGKTTLLKVILGLVSPVAGRVEVMGLPPRQGRGYVGYVPQGAGHDPEFPITVREAVHMGRLHRGNLLGRPSPEDFEAVEEALVRTGIQSLADRSVGELSMGQVQRTLFARALATRPAVLLLDEPTASMDPGAAASIYELLGRLNETMTIVMTSHDLTAVLSEVKTVACLNRTLHCHDRETLTAESIGTMYRCPVDMIARKGVPRREDGR
ncbi:MAG TPA: metal ABC transporter ATP-binding protein [Synergistaceae bacterium]|nr:metal ABC transporter ATP-binding protein [Synergistaceae bacterium]